MPTFEQINLFYIAVAVVCIPMLIGFFSEAGKDLYNKVRKKPSPDDVRTEFIEICRQNRLNCTTQTSLLGDIKELKEEAKELKEEAKVVDERQRTLREDRLPRIETTLTELKGSVSEISIKIDMLSKDMKDDIEKLFSLWNGLKLKQ